MVHTVKEMRDAGIENNGVGWRIRKGHFKRGGKDEKDIAMWNVEG